MSRDCAVRAAILNLLPLLLVVSLQPQAAAIGRVPADSPYVSSLYLPFVSYRPVCPTSSPNVYQSGIAYQYDLDDPVRPAANHADKNIELRGYTLVTDPSLALRLVDYGQDDDAAPQLGTLFAPSRLPPFTEVYRVHHWDWEGAPSPSPGARADPIETPPVTAVGLLTTPGEPLHVPVSGYSIGPGMEVMVLYADEDTVALRYGREDSVGGPERSYVPGGPGYVVHIDGICTDPNLISLYRALDKQDGPRYQYVAPEDRPYTYPLPTLAAHQELGVARGTEVVVAIADTGAFQDPRSGREFWREEWVYLLVGLVVSDNDYAKQWSLEKIGAPRAWALSKGFDTAIAILDTGVDLDHPDLAGNLLTDQGMDFVNQDLVPDDDHGHGTHVAGIAAATTDNGLGIAGVAWHTKLLPLKVLAPTGDGSATGTISDLTAAINYATDQRVDVINLSLGAPGISCSAAGGQVPLFREAVDRANGQGILLVAAAGNDGRAVTDMFPANCENVLGVAATDRYDNVAPYSNQGSHVSIAAPGGANDCTSCRIYSTVPGGTYGWLAGTSMATPHVAGLAALVATRYPAYTSGEISSAVLDNAVDLGSPGWDERLGCGRIDALATLLTGAHAPQPVCLQGVGSIAGGAAQTQTVFEPPFVPGQIIVALEPTGTAASLSSRLDGRLTPLSGLEAWTLHVPVGQEADMLDHLRADPAIRHAGLNYLVFAQ